MKQELTKKMLDALKEYESLGIADQKHQQGDRKIQEIAGG